jgi:hypothetical protein
VISELEIQRLVDAELSIVVELSRREALRATVIHPKAVRLKWNYGKPGQQFQCWVAARSENSQQYIVYCDQGFGPAYPWGIVGASEDSMGMDGQWHIGLEHAAIGARILEAPTEYEVP